MVKCLDEDLDELFSALGEPARRTILRDLTAGEKSLGDLAEPLPMTMAAVMKHISILERSGLVSTEKRGRTRYCRIRPQRLELAQDWISETTRFWAKRLESLKRHLEEES